MERKINWAIAGTGSISNRFAVGLKAARGAGLRAVVSRTGEKACSFASKYGIEKSFSNYDEMLTDASIDVVYIGTPHTTHKDLALRALKAKKAVLCEKPVCINSGEMREMINAARENKVFFMEAMWTRYVPSICKVREWLAQGLIGEVKMVEANFGFSTQRNPQGRHLNIELGGGALLDAGIYPLSMASMAFGGKKPEKIQSLMYFGQTGVDEENAALLSYGGCRIAQAKSALTVKMINDAWIYGADGRIHLPDFVFSHSANLTIEGKYTYHFEDNYYSNGYNYEAEEVMNCIREGKTESNIMPLDESLVLMETMDEIRAQWNFKYPCEKPTTSS
jgi:predicted dehydrogenase